jgi:hypothetical protein
MTESEIILTVPARHLTPGDHTHGYVVSQMQRVAGHHREFTFVVPYTTHFMKVRVFEKDLDAISFPLTKRGDAHDPNPRNIALGLPPAPEKVYVAPEPVAVYPVGTRIGDLKHFDRSQHVLFKCPDHPDSAWSSKDPRSSSVFPQTDKTRDCGPGCLVSIYDYVTTHEYKPTRNG